MMRINWKASLTAGALLISGAIVMNEFALGVAQKTPPDSFPATTPQPTVPAGPSPGIQPPKNAQPPVVALPGPSSAAETPLAPNSDPFAPSLDPMRYPKGVDTFDPAPWVHSQSEYTANAYPKGVDTFDPAPGGLQPQGVPFRRPQYSQEFLLSLNLLQNPEAEGPQRTAAREVVTKVLVEQFDEDMQSRQQQLEQLEKTLARLKAQFEKRKASRDQIVQLQLQLIENDAAGLGFPTSWNGMRGIGRWLEPHVDSHYPGHQLPPQNVPEPEPFNSSRFDPNSPDIVPRRSEGVPFGPESPEPPAADTDPAFRRQDNQNPNGAFSSDSTI